MKTVAAIVVASALAGASDAPVRVTGVSSEYCMQSEAIDMVVENVSETPLLSSVSVERLGDSSRWQEYSADVLSKESYPLKVTAFRLAKGESLRIKWRPRETGNEHQLREGSYRIVANSLIIGQPPGKRYVVASFAVRREACGEPQPVEK